MNKLTNSGKLAIVFAGIAIFSITACSSSSSKITKHEKDTAILVQISKPFSSERKVLNLSGQIEAGQSSTISTRVMGYITKLDVKTGDQVKQGQLLVSISNDDILAKRAQANAMIAEAQASFSNAQKDYQRFENLYKQESASAKEFDNVTQQYTAAKSRLEAARQMRNEVSASLKYTAIRAPFSGIVTQKLADVGSIANPGMTILTIEKSGSYQVSASVPENMINQIKHGEPASVFIKALDKTITGKISEVSQSSQFTGGQYIIKVQLPESEKQGLYAGMYADVSVAIDSGKSVKSAGNMVMVPLSAIDSKGQLNGIYTVGSNNKALLRWLRLGKTIGDQVEVLSGLSADEQFISSAKGPLHNGASIKITN